MRHRPYFLLDSDGILSDFVGAVLDFVEKHTGERPSRDAITTQRVWDHLDPALEAAFERHVKQPGFVLGIAPYPGAVEGVQRLTEIADVHVVTSPWKGAPTWMHERAEWLEQHFGIPFDHVHHETSKFLTRGDFFLDDHPRHLSEWLENSRDHFAGHALLWDTPHNRYDNTFRRVRSWGELLEIVTAKPSL